MGTDYSITEKFGKELAQLLAAKITAIRPAFPGKKFIRDISRSVANKTYTQRVALIADRLHQYFPGSYPEVLPVLLDILGDENPNETGMFTHYYWILPIGKYVEQYGIDYFDLSMAAIAEITKRNTGEYAVRPYIQRYPGKALKVMKQWALSDNFHLRRLASEGLRPRLPWATKLDTFVNEPQKVFEVLNLLKQDNVKFVKKSVANHLTDWLKVNRQPAVELIKKWSVSDNAHTQWIIRHATRKISI